MPYAFHSITVNHREILLTQILNGSAHPLSDFESTTFEFIRDWLSEENYFTTQTSGSTGTPKSITFTREQLQLSARRTLTALNLKPDHTVLVCLPTQFIAGKMMLVRAFEGNMKIIAVEPASNPFENLADDQRIDFMAVVPLQLQNLLSSTESVKRLNQIKAIIVGGAVVNQKIKNQLSQVTTKVYATYGMTETITHIALQLLTTPDQSEYFTTLPGVTIGEDERGCLVINDDILNTTVITNDLVEICAATAFTWRGRMDTVINSGGIKVSPEKIEGMLEQVFTQLNLNRNFFVAGLPHDTLGQQVVVILEGSSLPTENEHLIRHELTGLLSVYEIPKQVLYIPQFAFTPTGKINRPETLMRLVKD